MDLPVEALVLRPEYAPLFTQEELGRARTRLERFEYRMLGEHPAPHERPSDIDARPKWAATKGSMAAERPDARPPPRLR